MYLANSPPPQKPKKKKKSPNCVVQLSHEYEFFNIHETATRFYWLQKLWAISLYYTSIVMWMLDFAVEMHRIWSRGNECFSLPRKGTMLEQTNSVRWRIRVRRFQVKFYLGQLINITQHNVCFAVKCGDMWNLWILQNLKSDLLIMLFQSWLYRPRVGVMLLRNFMSS